MDFSLSQEQETIREAIAKICERFDDQYWLEKDKHGGFPADFHQALAKDGWLGICIPEVYGGSGLGITEAAIMMSKAPMWLLVSQVASSEQPVKPRGSAAPKSERVRS